MNGYQKVALGGLIVSVTGLVTVVAYGLTGMVMLTVLIFVGYLLMLRTVRKLLWAAAMVMWLIVGDVGSLIGKLGHKLAEVCADRCDKLAALSTRSQRGYVPEWDDLLSSTDDSQELELPETSTETERQYS
jgi:hypothetical protein